MEEELKKINPYALGASFLQFAEKKGWLLNKGNVNRPYYFLTEKGEKEFTKKPYNFDLKKIIAKS